MPDSFLISKFRASFKFDKEDRRYIQKVGLEKIEAHAKDFVTKRLAGANLENDGRQTPFRGHPVFKAQHATATCCRGCILKWHGIPKGRILTEDEISFVVSKIMNWVNKQFG